MVALRNPCRSIYLWEGVAWRFDLEEAVISAHRPPGIGKTTALKGTVELLRKRGCVVGGMVTQEVKGAGGEREGFEVLDLSSLRRGRFARASEGPGPRIGRYIVDIGTVELVGVASILEAIASSDVIAIDEIGPMELLSEGFRVAVGMAIKGEKPVVATVHFRSSDPLVASIKAREDASLFILSFENRGLIPRTILRQVLSAMSDF